MQGIMSDSEKSQKAQEQTNHHHHAKKPNKLLSPNEKKAKRALKRKLKLQQKQIKLETRLRHAISRKDTRVEEQTRQALKHMKNQQEAAEEGEASMDSQICLQQDGTSKLSNDTTTKNIETEALSPNPDIAAARRLITQLYQRLQSSQAGNSGIDEKEDQHRDAVSLLKHMTKGTQSRCMFDNEKALWGYTRQKFFERAMLVNTSFGKLRYVPLDGGEQCRLQRVAWNTLTNNSLKRICSIGCGPGNDIVGVVAFLQSLRQQEEERPNEWSGTLERVVMLDWAIVEWEKAVVNHLANLLVPQYVEALETSFCDVTMSLHTPSNLAAWRALLPSQEHAADDNNHDTMQHDATNDTTCGIDLFLFSYILTEQRGLWNEFLSNTVQLAKPGALFYFSEPTPWQLHVVCKMFTSQLDFIWLDSSMYNPSLQVLDGRVGPGVLMGIKKRVANP